MKPIEVPTDLLSTDTPHGLPPWVVAVGLAAPWSPPGGPQALIPDDVVLLLITGAIAVSAWRATPRLDRSSLQWASGVGFAASLVVKHGLPVELLPGVAIVSGALLYGIAFPRVAAVLFGGDAPPERRG